VLDDRSADVLTQLDRVDVARREQVAVLDRRDRRVFTIAADDDDLAALACSADCRMPIAESSL
jgi:hypothetical protein